MKPEEKRLIVMGFQPTDGMIDAVFRAALHQADVFLKELLPGKRIIVILETASEPPTPV